MTGKKKAASPPTNAPAGRGAKGSAKASAKAEKMRAKAAKAAAPPAPAASDAMGRRPQAGRDLVAKVVHDVMHPQPDAGPPTSRGSTVTGAVPARDDRKPAAAGVVERDLRHASDGATAPRTLDADAMVAPAQVSRDEPPVPPASPAGKSPSAATAAAPAPPAGPVPLPIPDFEVLSRNMSQLMEESGKLAASFYDGDKPRPAMKADMSDAVQTLGQVAEHWFVDPARLIQAQTTLTTQFFELWASSARRVATGADEPPPARQPPPDKRFKDPEWRENPVYDFVHKAFLLGSSWANKLIDDAEGLDDPTRERARFYMRQITSALSPSNFVPTNPELLRETLKQNGGNLLRGMKMLAEDLAAGHGQLRIRHTDSSKFALGVNMAMTPGKVVFRNDLIELLQYAPTTPQVLARPLLVVPPWINKFYVLDLNPEKSFIRWAVEQGLTVFLISWVNPDERHAAKDFESYMREGVLAALDEIGAITGEPDATAIGYCVGGTLLAVTLAHMAARGDTRISSATLFTAQVDFSHAGDLKVFADEGQIRSLEAQMRDQGYLQGAHMAQAFNMLRPEELIWSYVVNNYLKGKDPQPFDLLAWNSDSTRMPAANHSFYLRNCYLENKLAQGLMEVAGERLDLGKVKTPIYNLATREDHIAPAISVFEGCKYFGGPVSYILSGSGHVAGVVNPPNKVKYGFVEGPEPRGTLDGWLEHAVEHPGSWWPHWYEWIRAQAPAVVAAREPGGGRETLGDAPGTYVRVRA